MFAIYDIEGRRFHDTLENLRRVRKLNAGNKDSNAAENGLQKHHNSSGSDDEDVVSNKAIQAYRKIRHLSQREPVFHAYQVMSHPVSTVPMEMSVIEAHRKFQEHGYQQMPVISLQQRIVGLLTIKDLMRFIIIDGEQTHYISGKKIEDIISKEVITTDPVTDIRRVAQIMCEYHITAIPIVNDQDALVGIVSRGDILRTVMNDPPLNIWS